MNTTPASREEAGQVPKFCSGLHLENVGNTPVFQCALPQLPEVCLHVKLEGVNPTGSAKDRAAWHVLRSGLASGTLHEGVTVVESSSGNFGISLGHYCRYFGLRFYCVIDPNISAENEALLRTVCTKVIKVTEPDCNGGYLLTRLSTIKQIQCEEECYWVNQYANPINAEAYDSLGEEICRLKVTPDFVFVGVSSCGTIMGVSRSVKRVYPDCRIVGVDSLGSVIFGGSPKKRLIPGIGSSVVPAILDRTKVDAVVTVPENAAIQQCHSFSKTHGFLIGGSSGAVVAAVISYFRAHPAKRNTNVVGIFHDRGERYLSTVYNEDWCITNFKNDLY